MAHARHFDHSFRPLIRAAVAVSWMCVALPVCSAQPQEQAQSNSVSGTVVDSITREPINRALVYSPDNRFGTMTDDRGHFTFDVSNVDAQATPDMPPPRPNVLMAKKPGYLDDRSKPAQIINADQKDITIELTPESLIVGHVTFPDPADRAQVVLYKQQVQDGIARWGQMKQVRSRSDGEFRFADLAAGKYKVFTLESTNRDPLTTGPNVLAYEYPPAYFPNARDFASAQTIELGTAKTFVANLSPQRKPYYQVKIPVLADAGAQLSPQVTVYPQGQRGPGYQLGFNQMESAVNGMMPDGTYTVELTSYGPQSASGVGTLTVHGAPALGQPIALIPDPSIPVEIRQEFTSTDQQQTGQVGGVVTGITSYGPPPEPNQPAAYVTLQPADDFGGERVVSMQADNNEAPRIPNIPPGRYWVVANAVRGYVAAITSGGKDLLHQPLVVAPGSGDQPIEIVVRDDSATLEFSVAANRGPAPGSVEPGIYRFGGGSIASGSGGQQGYVYLVPLPDSPGRFMETGIWSSNGAMTLGQIPPGTYRIMAFESPQQIEYRSPAAMKAYESKGQVVTFAPGQKQQVQLQIIKGNSQ